MATAVGSTSSSAQSLEGFINSKKSDQVSKDQFLQLLVTQLKNQDPLDPMKSEEFAVNLAQFSQLEQLVSINDKIGTKETDMSSLAAYLGQEVTLNSDKVHVEGEDAGHVKIELPSDVDGLEVQLMNSSGTVAKTIRYDALSQGKQTLALGAVNLPNGDYSMKITATGVNGNFQVEGKPSGVVTGFVPGPQPTLLVHGREIGIADILEVSVPATEKSA